jgi:hypothetical protein
MSISFSGIPKPSWRIIGVTYEVELTSFPISPVFIIERSVRRSESADGP